MTREEAYEEIKNKTVDLSLEAYNAAKLGFNFGWDAAKAEKPEPVIPDKPGWYAWDNKEGERGYWEFKMDGDKLYYHGNSAKRFINLGYKFYPASPPWEVKQCLDK